MDIFNIDQDSIVGTISGALEDAGVKAAEEMMSNIIERIDDALPGLIGLLVEDTTDYWKDSASSINGWGQKYAEGIKNKIGDNEGSVYLDENVSVKVGDKTFKASVFAKKIEDGVKSWSIRDALMQSEKAKVSKDGIKYIVIPLPVSAPRKESQGKMLSKFGGREMDSDIHNLVKGGGRAPKGTLSTSGQNISGLTKFVTTQFNESYGIFRCVTQNSPGWQYPDKPAVPVFNSVKEYVDKRINEMIVKFCQAVVKEFS